ncbi:MAG TPA: hypothetical protein VFX85_06390 [Solirubrobacterales bacterium]|nr:hypothetical protein [Solirubrobacterales bacterium]
MLDPRQIVGRDTLIAAVWSTLESQSVLLTSERRMGKTSVMRKMTDEPPTGSHPIRRSLQGINTPEEFARALVADVEANLPGVLAKPFLKRLRKAGVKRVGAKSVEVEFEPANDDAWKEVVLETFGTIESGVDERVIFLWDELPHMIDAIVAKRDAGTARDMLDVLRFARETHPSIRMVLSGSLGIHHVVDKLRLEGGMWVPTHDMVLIDVPPLNASDAIYLAVELLRNEQIDCDEEATVAEAIATEVDYVPYYVHHTVAELQHRRAESAEPASGQVARDVIEAVLISPQDPWQLKHYVDRVPVYYPRERDLAFAVLDIVAAAPASISQDEIEAGLAARMSPPDAGRLHDLLELLCKDHYVEVGYRFRLDLVRRAWQARRPPQ